MEFIVIKSQDLRVLGTVDGHSFSIPLKDRPGAYYANEADACAAAQEKAEKEPGVVYVVMKPLVAYEAKKPEKIDVVVKEYTANGELVPMKV